MATTDDYSFLDLKLGKVNFNSLIIQLDIFFEKKSVVLSYRSYLKLVFRIVILKIDLRFTDLYQIKQKP